MTSKINISSAQALKALKRHGGNRSAAARELGVSETTIRRRLDIRPTVSSPKNKVEKEQEKLTLVQEHKLRKENQQLKAQLKDVGTSQAQDEQLSSLLVNFMSSSFDAPIKKLQPKSKKRVDRAIITALLSDLHLDEVVDPAQINYVNAYDREIAVMRLENFFKNIIRLSEEFINGIKIDGLVVAMLGDMVGGNIHEELRESNEDMITGTTLFWAEQIASGLKLLAEHFDWIYVPCVVGNHGRNTLKPRMKFRARDNWDWMLYNIVSLHCKDIPEITFEISTGTDLRYPVYETHYQITHGDQFRGGAGIAGMFSPLMLGNHRKQTREASVGTPYDYLIMGHWHQRANFKSLIINGSLKGYDEYAYTSNFPFEPPQQSLYLTDPKHGKTIEMPIRVVDKKEWWRK